MKLKEHQDMIMLLLLIFAVHWLEKSFVADIFLNGKKQNMEH